MKTIEQSGRGAILGDIWFEISEKAFPSDDWNDFVVDILTWWLKEVTLLKEQKPGKVHKLLFMDGPFLINLERESNDEVRVECHYERTTGFETLLVDHCQVSEIWNEILSASRRILDFIDGRGWDTIEIQRLREAYNLAMSPGK